MGEKQGRTLSHNLSDERDLVPGLLCKQRIVGVIRSLICRASSAPVWGRGVLRDDVKCTLQLRNSNGDWGVPGRINSSTALIHPLLVIGVH